MSLKKSLGVMPLALLTVAAIVSLRNLPLSAVFGYASVFYLSLAAIVFFIPIALVTAELGSTWPKAGANYIWVAEAFGKKWGFLALMLAWMESIAWFPAILAFCAAMLGYVLCPWFSCLHENRWFILIVMWTIFWSATLLNFFGIQISSWFSSFSLTIGTLIPGVLLILIGAVWIFGDHTLAATWSLDAFIPDFSQVDNIVLFSGILLGLAGVELSAYHVAESKNPKRDYPRALLIATVVILTVYILGTLAVVVLVPQAELSLLGGLAQAFEVFFNSIGVQIGLPVIAFFLFFGSLAGVNTWTIGPAKGLLVCAEDGFLPPVLKKVNKKNVPTGMLIFQAIIGTLLSLVFLFMEDTSTAFWVLTGLSAQFTMMQYVLVFLAAFWLRIKQKDTPRPYRVPGGWFGITLATLVGTAACIFGFLIVFWPPAQLMTGDHDVYVALLSGMLILLTAVPLVLIRWRSSSLLKHDTA